MLVHALRLVCRFISRPGSALKRLGLRGTHLCGLPPGSDAGDKYNLDGVGISLNGYLRNTSVARNDFSWIGDSAMTSWGHTSYCLNANCSWKLCDSHPGSLKLGLPRRACCSCPRMLAAHPSHARSRLTAQAVPGGPRRAGRRAAVEYDGRVQSGARDRHLAEAVEHVVPGDDAADDPTWQRSLQRTTGGTPHAAPRPKALDPNPDLSPSSHHFNGLRVVCSVVFAWLSSAPSPVHD